MKKYIYLPLEMYFPKHNVFIENILSRFNVILPFKYNKVTLQDSNNILYLEDLVSSELDQKDVKNFNIETDKFYKYLIHTVSGITKKTLNQNSLESLRPRLNNSLAKSFLQAEMFKKIVEKDLVGLVIVSAEYAGLSRPIVIEAQAKKIPVINIEHGNNSIGDYPEVQSNPAYNFTMNIADYGILDNKLETDIFSKNLKASGQRSNTQFLPFGTPISQNDKAFKLDPAKAKSLLGINPNIKTIGLFGTWCEPRSIQSIFQKQMDEADYYEFTFRLLNKVKSNFPIQPIIKFHPALSRFKEIGVINFIIDLAVKYDLPKPIILFDKYEEAIAASDYVITSVKGSSSWAGLQSFKPTAEFIPKYTNHYFDINKMMKYNECVTSDLLHYIFNDGDFKKFISRYHDKYERELLTKRLNEFNNKWDIKNDSVDVISNRICNWIDDKFPELNSSPGKKLAPANINKFKKEKSMKNNSRVNVVIVTYNSASTIRNCLLSVIKFSTSQTKVTVIDNASSDDTLKVLKEFSNKISLIKNAENRGFSAACNQGIKAMDFDFVVLLNPDTIVTNGWVEKLIQKFDDGIGAVGPTTDYTGGMQQAIRYLPKNFEQNTVTIDSVINELEKNKTKSVETKLLIGFCMMISRQALETVGLLDEKLFLGNDDLDLSWRMRLAGIKLMVAVDTFIHHKGQVSFNSEEKSVTDNLIRQSTDILFKKLENHYGKNNVPTSNELWNNDWFKPTHAVFNPESKLHTSKRDIELNISLNGIKLHQINGENKVKKIDTFMYNGDFIAPFRIKYLYDVIDEFIIVESRYTHTGQRKENLYFKEEDFAPYLDKITYLVQDEKIDKVPEYWKKENEDKYWVQENPLAWFREYSQRNFCINHLEKEQRNYMLICSDVDEIPNRNLLDKIDYDMLKQPLYLEMDMFYYNFNWKKKTKWYQAFIINNVNSGLTELRACSGEKQFLKNAGWHLSFFMAKDDIKRKLSSFAHSEYSGEEFSADDHIQKCIDEGNELFNRHGVEELVKNDNFNDLPLGWKGLQHLLNKPDSTSTKDEEVNDHPVVSIIILTFNALEFTRKCIDSIMKHTSAHYEIVFVDNASSDGTVEYLTEMCENNDHFSLIRNNENRGFAIGNNQGVKAAKGKYVLLLNNDVLVSHGWLSSMVEALEKHDKIGMVGPMTNSISGLQRIINISYDVDTGFEPFASQVRHTNAGNLTPRRRIAGFAMLMEKHLYDDVGGFDESFGSGNFEDDDFCLRVRARGKAIMVDESTFIHHFGSQTFKANGINYNQSLNKKSKIFFKKWPGVDHEELLEVNTPLTEVHENKVKAGMRQLESNQYALASKTFKAILKQNPISADSLFGLAIVHQFMAENSAALKRIEELKSLYPDFPEIDNHHGSLLFETEDYSAAQEVFANTLEKTPNDVNAARNLVRTLVKLDSFDEAVALAIEVFNKNTEDEESLLLMAELNIEANRMDDARDYLGKIININPENMQAVNYLKEMETAPAA